MSRLKGIALWDAIEQAARRQHGVGEDWHLRMVDMTEDEEIIRYRLNRRGPRGGWPSGRENRVNGMMTRVRVEEEAAREETM